MAGPDRAFWEQKFDAGQTPWDRGAANPQLSAWLQDGTLAPGMRVLVPGCGTGHEVAALARAGFEVTGLDYAQAAIQRTHARVDELEAAMRMRVALVHADALEWQPDRPFDAVYEQTCLCALHPDHWVQYAAQLQRWVVAGGRLCLLAMQAPKPGAAEGQVQGPPYHCDIHAVRALFTAREWDWPKPPYARVDHPNGFAELAVVLTRRAAAL